MGRYLALVPMALALAACGGGGGGGLSLDPVASAATKTAKSGGEHMTFRVHMTLADTSFAVIGSGDFDAAKRVGRTSLRFSGLPQLSGTGEEIIQGTIVYARFPFLAGKLPGGKQWVKIDLGKEGRTVGVNLNALMQGSTTDPTQMLRYLEAASTGVQKIGPDTVAGAATTHYSAAVDFDKLVRVRPKEKRSIRRVEQLTGVHAVPVDVWIDGDGYVRKVKESFTMHLPQGPSAIVVMTFQLSDFGRHVTVTPPPAAEVLDVSSLSGTGG